MGCRYRYDCVLQGELIKTGKREFSVGNGRLENYFPFQAHWLVRKIARNDY